MERKRERESERAKQSAALLHSGLVCCHELWIAAAAIPEYHSSPESELGSVAAGERRGVSSQRAQKEGAGKINNELASLSLCKVMTAAILGIEFFCEVI